MTQIISCEIFSISFEQYNPGSSRVISTSVVMFTYTQVQKFKTGGMEGGMENALTLMERIENGEKYSAQTLPKFLFLGLGGEDVGTPYNMLVEE